VSVPILNKTEKIFDFSVGQTVEGKDSRRAARIFLHNWGQSCGSGSRIKKVSVVLTFLPPPMFMAETEHLRVKDLRHDLERLDDPRPGAVEILIAVR